MAAAAEQPVDRLTAGLADQVPERDLDAADGRHHGRAALVLVADHPADDGLDVERIAAEHPALDPLVGQGLDRLFLPLQRRLADARQAGVGAQADEQVIPQAGVGQEGLEGDRSSWLGVPHRTAIGLPGEPVAPLRRNGAKMKANS